MGKDRTDTAEEQFFRIGPGEHTTPEGYLAGYLGTRHGTARRLRQRLPRTEISQAMLARFDILFSRMLSLLGCLMNGWADFGI